MCYVTTKHKVSVFFFCEDDLFLSIILRDVSEEYIGQNTYYLSLSRNETKCISKLTDSSSTKKALPLILQFIIL